MHLLIRGHSEIARQLVALWPWSLQPEIYLPRLPRVPDVEAIVPALFINQGLLTDVPEDAIRVNFDEVYALCEHVLTRQPLARICVMGSESDYRGSYLQAYSSAKRMLHHYVETRRVGPGQQLVAVSCGIIADAGMTTRREDQDRVAERAATHPRKRHVVSAEVAQLVHFLLTGPAYLSNTVVRMHGGLA